MTFKKPFEITVDNIPEEGVNFFLELYNIMKKYNIHRIYTAYLNDKKLVSTEQLLSVYTEDRSLKNIICRWLDKHFPRLYLHTFFKIHIIKYRIELKRLFNKYGIQKIISNSFNLYQGINITQNSLCIHEIDLVFKAGNVVRIDHIHLDI